MQRAGRRERVRRVGVIDEHGERLPGVHRLEAAGDAMHRSDAFGDLVRVEVEQQSGGDGGENVFDVEQSAQRGLTRMPAARNERRVAAGSRSSTRTSASSASPNVTSGARCLAASSSASRRPQGSPMFTAAGGAAAVKRRRFASK